jgi:putative RNA 2'-phosphotransferase
MNKEESTNLSKFMSYVLRHKPEDYNLSITGEGWVSVNSLEKAALKDGHTLNFEKINNIVSNCKKKRFQFSEDFSKIRAVQGHSCKEVDISFRKEIAPEFLYHGTTVRFIDSILKTGLSKMNRHFVHLSPDIITARNVGIRHGKVVILRIKSREMNEEGFEFSLSANNVWLVKEVPVKYIEVFD